MYTEKTELRKLHPVEIQKLAQFLGESDLWRKLIAVIKDEDARGQMLFTTDHVKIIENASRLVKKPESEIFLEEWSIMGKKRPTIGILLHYLIELELFRAADYLAVDLLKSKRPARPTYGPAAEIKIDDSILELVSISNLLRGGNTNPIESQPTTFSNHYQGSTARIRSADNSVRSNLIKFSTLEMIRFSKSLQNELTRSAASQNSENRNVVQNDLSRPMPHQNYENKNNVPPHVLAPVIHQYIENKNMIVPTYVVRPAIQQYFGNGNNVVQNPMFVPTNYQPIDNTQGMVQACNSGQPPYQHIQNKNVIVENQVSGLTSHPSNENKNVIVENQVLGPTSHTNNENKNVIVQKRRLEPIAQQSEDDSSEDSEIDENKIKNYNNELSIADSADIPIFVRNVNQDEKNETDNEDTSNSHKSEVDTNTRSKNLETDRTTDSPHLKCTTSESKGPEYESSISDLAIPLCVLEANMDADKSKENNSGEKSQ